MQKNVYAEREEGRDLGRTGGIQRDIIYFKLQQDTNNKGRGNVKIGGKKYTKNGGKKWGTPPSRPRTTRNSNRRPGYSGASSRQRKKKKERKLTGTRPVLPRRGRGEAGSLKSAGVPSAPKFNRVRPESASGTKKFIGGKKEG